MKTAKTLAPSPQHVPAYLDAGFELIPLRNWNATIYNPKTGQDEPAGKLPLVKGWRDMTPLSLESAQHHMRNGGNLGVRLTADWLIIDFDPRNAGADPDGVWRRFLEAFAVDLKLYPIVETGSGGFHVYSRKPAHVQISKGLPDFPGVDFLSAGRFVVAAGSIHPVTKRPYTFKGAFR